LTIFQKQWKSFVFQLITSKEIKEKIKEEEDVLIDALLNVKKLNYNENYE
jgi:hypothetical protein